MGSRGCGHTQHGVEIVFDSLVYVCLLHATVGSTRNDSLCRLYLVNPKKCT